VPAKGLTCECATFEMCSILSFIIRSNTPPVYVRGVLQCVAVCYTCVANVPHSKCVLLCLSLFAIGLHLCMCGVCCSVLQYTLVLQMCHDVFYRVCRCLLQYCTYACVGCVAVCYTCIAKVPRLVLSCP